MEKITESIWSLEYSSKLMPGVSFPTRTIFIELKNNEVLIISPGPFGEEKFKEVLSSYSKVYCATLNSMHHLHLQSFHKIFPQVSIYGPKTILKKQPWIQGTLKDLEELKTILSDQLTFIKIEGNQLLDETVLYCSNSKSLITTDLLFNMREPMSWVMRCLLKMVGAYSKIGQSKLVKFTTKDVASYKKSIHSLKELGCERIILSHGQIVTEDNVEEAFEEML